MSATPASGRAFRLLLWMAASSVLAALGCGLTGPGGHLDEERERLLQARTQWRAQSVQDYRFTFRRICFCGPAAVEPVVVTVRGGVIVTVERVANGVPQDPALYYTVEGLFALLENAIDQDAHELRADYDLALGFPASAFIDQNAMIADEELGFHVSDLQRLR